MIKEKYLEVLIKNPLFSGLDKEQLSKLLNCFAPRVAEFAKNSYLVSKGDVFKGIGLVVEGGVKILKETISGDHTIVATLGEGSVFGEMAAFSKTSFWPSTVQAQTFTTVIFISSDRIVESCSKTCPFHTQFIRNFLTELSEKGIYLNKKISYLSIKSMIGKISSYLYEQYYKGGKNPVFSIPLSRNELADYLSVSRPSLSRELGVMKRENVIDYHLNTFKILDLDRLMDMMG